MWYSGSAWKSGGTAQLYGVEIDCIVDQVESLVLPGVCLLWYVPLSRLWTQNVVPCHNCGGVVNKRHILAMCIAMASRYTASFVLYELLTRNVWKRLVLSYPTESHTIRTSHHTVDTISSTYPSRSVHQNTSPDSTGSR